MSAMQKYEVLFILGGPGAGKGTLCRYISERYGYAHLSAGDLLRQERMRPDSEHAELINSCIANGSIVPVAITFSLLERAMQTSNSPHKRFLIDGFPRNQENINGWNKEMVDKCEIKGVLYCECSMEVCTERCLKRGAAGSGRNDDNEESLIKRHETYINNTVPIIEHFEKLGLMYKINSMQKPEKVFEDAKEILQKIGWFLLIISRLHFIIVLAVGIAVIFNLYIQVW